jgi:hypothetical protein
MVARHPAIWRHRQAALKITGSETSQVVLFTFARQGGRGVRGHQERDGWSERMGGGRPVAQLLRGTQASKVIASVSKEKTKASLEA